MCVATIQLLDRAQPREHLVLSSVTPSVPRRAPLAKVFNFPLVLPLSNVAHAYSEVCGLQKGQRLSFVPLCSLTRNAVFSAAVNAVYSAAVYATYAVYPAAVHAVYSAAVNAGCILCYVCLCLSYELLHTLV